MFPCQRISKPSASRRQWLQNAACGFGAVALSAMWAEEGRATQEQKKGPNHPLKPKTTHFPAKAKRVIYLYMDGGPSQVDTFDPKPRLTRDNGKPFAMMKEPTQFNNNGNTLGSLWDFNRHGESGTPVSSLFPNISKHVDDMAVIRSMVSNFSEHTNAN